MRIYFAETDVGLKSQIHEMLGLEFNPEEEWTSVENQILVELEQELQEDGE